MERPTSSVAAAGPGPGTTDAVDVFVSHVEEDATVALTLADALEAEGFTTWCYERDSIPGPSYLLQTAEAIERSRAVVVVISAHALGSNQVTAEVVRAHEAVKPFLPVLVGISQVEFGARQPEWREAIGSATSITVPEAGVEVIVPRIVNGLKALGIAPGEPAARVPRPETVRPLERPSARPLPSTRRRPLWLWVALGVAVLLVAVVGLVLLRGGGEKGASPQPTTQPTSGPSVTSEPTFEPTSAPTGGSDVKDAATTPIETSQGPARISSASLVSRECPPAGLPGACRTAPSGQRYLLLDIRAWGGGDLAFNEALSMEGISTYVSFEGRRASPVQTWVLEASPSGFRIVYATLPASAAGKDVNLFWHDNPPLRFRPGG
jgi:hypothetical protein